MTEAQGPNGDCANRRDCLGQWLGVTCVEDCWGRSLWGLGTAAARSPDDEVRQAALAHFERGARQRSQWARAMAFATLGAHEVLVAYPDHRVAFELLGAAAGVMVEAAAGVMVEAAADVMVEAADVMVGQAAGEPWPWPEPRLTYANAVLPDSMMAAGAALGRQGLVNKGLDLLALAARPRDQRTGTCR